LSASSDVEGVSREFDNVDMSPGTLNVTNKSETAIVPWSGWLAHANWVTDWTVDKDNLSDAFRVVSNERDIRMRHRIGGE